MRPARTPRTRERTSSVISPSKIVIAPEGVSTEVNYFLGIKSKLSRRFEQLIEILVIKRGEQEDEPEEKDKAIGSSAPKQVLDYAESYIQSLDTLFNKNMDSLTLVLDKDRWSDKQLSEVYQLCNQKDYELLVSNPAFELWLLLHHCDVSSLDAELQEKIFKNKGIPKKQAAFLKEYLKEHVNGFDYKNLNIDDFYPLIENAIANAEKLDRPEKGWPNELGTTVDQLIKKLPLK
ncbi:RloB family protein [Vibrio crassostreae]|uniref:RloB family protein n=1 Tax=Vibrio crassostreae TaxID=246167 RepID=UPI000F4A5C5A|nr:RloB family protein [Vibrio crassostreae]ROO77324.1 RloB-like protein [Vibrio crassostreae]ROR75103.1 RloB-like protein [Vibrio crassostreae]